MLPDRFFYPLIALICAAMIWGALEFGPRAQAKDNPLSGDPLQGLYIAGENLGLLQDGPGLVHELQQDDTGKWVVQASAGQRPGEGTKSAGIFLTVPPRFAKAWRGHTLRITAQLRQPETNPSADVSLAYYAVGQGNSHPVTCPVGNDWQPCILTYTLPKSDKPDKLQFIGIWPDTLGLSRNIDIGSLQVEIVAPQQIGLKPEPVTQPKTEQE